MQALGFLKGASGVHTQPVVSQEPDLGRRSSECLECFKQSIKHTGEHNTGEHFARAESMRMENTRLFLHT